VSSLEQVIAATAPAEHVAVDYTRNRRTVLSLRQRGGRWAFRAHEIFRSAPADVLRAVARLYFTRTRRDTRRRLSQLIQSFIAENETRIEALATGRPRRPALYGHRGKVYNLKEIFDELNAQFFNGTQKALLTWSRTINRRKLGTWRLLPDGDEAVIRINRLLDDSSVPSYVIRQLVLHEMLHGVFRSEKHGHRTVRHTKAFREFERRSPMYEQARQWERENLHALYRKRTETNRKRKRSCA